MKNSGKVESGGKDRVFIRHTIDSHPHHDMPCHWHATTKCMRLRGNQMMGWLVDVMYTLGFGCCGHNACDCMISLVDCGTIHGTVPNLDYLDLRGNGWSSRLFAIDKVEGCLGRSFQPILFMRGFPQWSSYSRMSRVSKMYSKKGVTRASWIGKMMVGNTLTSYWWLGFGLDLSIQCFGGSHSIFVCMLDYHSYNHISIDHDAGHREHPISNPHSYHSFVDDQISVFYSSISLYWRSPKLDLIDPKRRQARPVWSVATNVSISIPAFVFTHVDCAAVRKLHKHIY